ncbi:hypothetical protein ACFU9X_44320, partial [Streptomyces atratus]|uniref:hypothetical protein n=1 Tax=Streptomyces atratus TaxID=1893 RepID=UPI0036A3746B
GISRPPSMKLTQLVRLSCRTPASEYYGDSATIWLHQRASRLPAARLEAGREGRCQIASHVH